MTNPVATVRHEGVYGDDTREVVREALMFWCPGCDSLHRIIWWQKEGLEGPVWEWDQNLEAPTISPSILCHNSYHPCGREAHPGKPCPRSEEWGQCHSFLRAGVWDFLSDCAHPLAGQKIPMVPLPDWMVEK